MKRVEAREVKNGTIIKLDGYWCIMCGWDGFGYRIVDRWHAPKCRVRNDELVELPATKRPSDGQKTIRRVEGRRAPKIT